MENISYNQFCPVAMAAEILCKRWTIILLRELCAGSTRIEDLHKGVPSMSASLLAERLTEMESYGILQIVPIDGQPDDFDFILTGAGRELQPVVAALGIWGQRWIESVPSLKNLDPRLLMWDMQRNLHIKHLPGRSLAMQFFYPELETDRQYWWLLIDDEGSVRLSQEQPEFAPDLYVESDLRTMTAIWMGLDSVPAAITSKRLQLTGDAAICKTMQSWLGLSPFAVEKKLVA